MFNFIRNLFTKQENDTIIKKSREPIYRVIDIVETDKQQYKAVIQVINKKECFRIAPENILADDRLTEAFHQFDIRLLTYLGYCGINSPQFKILAKKILKDENIQLALFDKTSNDLMLINTNDIATGDINIISNLAPKDAYELGYSHGRTSILKEKDLLKQYK